MIKTIADPLINTCVMRGYKDGEVLPVLKIPTAEPLIADAGDWKARFETVKVTFSNRVGLISNTALRSGIIAYNESTDSTEREQSRKETETLAILTGLEIDSAKSGIRPDLSEFLVSNRGRKSLFLRYKNIFGDDDSEKKWYEDSQQTKIKKFIASVNWDTVTANLELLPYPIDRREPKIDLGGALKCAIALGERQFALEVLPGVMLEYAAAPQNEPEKKKRWFRA